MTNAETPFAGRTAVVTGGASGLGLQVAWDLASRGAAVAILDLTRDASRSAADGISENGGTALGLGCDVASEAAVGAALDAVAEWAGTPSLLVNSAAIVSHPLAEDLSIDEFRRVLDVNLLGPFIVTQRLVRGLINQGRPGAVVNVASVGGFRTYRPEAFSDATPPRYDGVAYTSSKAGLIHMTRSLARTWAHFGIRVNAVSPSGMATPLLDGGPLASAAGKTPPLMGRMATTSEVSAGVVFLLSDEASYITGENLIVDGGATL